MLQVLRCPIRRARILLVVGVTLVAASVVGPASATPRADKATPTLVEILDSTIEQVTQAASRSVPLAKSQRVERDEPRPGAPAPLARVDGVALTIPSHHARILGFHEAASSSARQMLAAPSPIARTLPSRGRGTPNRSAVDVAVDPGTPVLAPVSGRVTETGSYALYGRYADEAVHVVPDDDPQRVVKVLHVTGARVAAGDRVEAGRTVIAERSTQFPFVSQVEEEAGRVPHVHIEVQPR